MIDENDNTDTKSPPDASMFFYPGTVADRIEMQLGVLTKGVVDCMLLATGDFPDLTEGVAPPAGGYPPHMPMPKVKSGPVTAWQAARSAELRDAARLSEASARLLEGFAKFRGQFSQDFTIRHSSKRGAHKKVRADTTTMVHTFSVPSAPGAELDLQAQDVRRGLTKVAEDMAARTGASRPDDDDALEALKRQLGIDDDGNDLPGVSRNTE